MASTCGAARKLFFKCQAHLVQHKLFFKWQANQAHMAMLVVVVVNWSRLINFCVTNQQAGILYDVGVQYDRIALQIRIHSNM